MTSTDRYATIQRNSVQGEASVRAVDWDKGTVRLIDQRRLPWELVTAEYRDHESLAQAVSDMVVRGAPAIGVTAGYGMALAGLRSQANSLDTLRADLRQALDVLEHARPTAVNLAWALQRQWSVAADPTWKTPDDVRAALIREAHAMADEDIAINRRMGLHGAELISDGDVILHHCNTGALAAVDYGTALGVIRTAHEQGKRLHVLVDETRPRLQGARLTAWELKNLGIPFDIIADSAAGHLMRTGRVDLVLVGADRIAANGDVANKIGTYTIAVLARECGVPFYSVAPCSTIDLALSDGDQIPIEQRSAEEVLTVLGHPTAPEGATALNPAFDVTPSRYLTAVVTEVGLVYPPLARNLRRAMSGGIE